MWLGRVGALVAGPQVAQDPVDPLLTKGGASHFPSVARARGTGP